MLNILLRMVHQQTLISRSMKYCRWSSWRRTRQTCRRHSWSLTSNRIGMKGSWDHAYMWLHCRMKAYKNYLVLPISTRCIFMNTFISHLVYYRSLVLERGGIDILFILNFHKFIIVTFFQLFFFSMVKTCSCSKHVVVVAIGTTAVLCSSVHILKDHVDHVLYLVKNNESFFYY
jgi:hypothetical protein